MKTQNFASFILTPLNRLKYSQKYVLINLLFVLPLVVGIYLLLTELNTRLDHYGWHEKYGTVYLRSLRILFEDAQKYRELAYETISSGDTSQQETLVALQDQIDRDFEALALVDRQYDALLDSTSRFNALREDWEMLKPRTLKLKARESYDLHTQFMANIRGLISHVGDASFLILDPELDSYYMMDTVLLKLPEAQELLAQTIILGKDAATSQALSVDEKVQLIILSSLMKSNLEAMEVSVRTALANNPAHNLKSLLEGPFQEDITTTEQFLKLIDSEIINASSAMDIDPAKFETLGHQTLQASFNFYDAASPALEDLLQA
ncbi:MAG: hypothetical protein AB1801_06440, partial [Chloroflexota bacterium]